LVGRVLWCVARDFGRPLPRLGVTSSSLVTTLHQAGARIIQPASDPPSAHDPSSQAGRLRTCQGGGLGVNSATLPACRRGTAGTPRRPPPGRSASAIAATSGRLAGVIRWNQRVSHPSRVVGTHGCLSVRECNQRADAPGPHRFERTFLRDFTGAAFRVVVELDSGRFRPSLLYRTSARRGRRRRSGCSGGGLA